MYFMSINIHSALSHRRLTQYKTSVHTQVYKFNYKKNIATMVVLKTNQEQPIILQQEKTNCGMVAESWQTNYLLHYEVNHSRWNTQKLKLKLFVMH